MKNFSNAIRDAVEKRNWYAALTTALILPDVCARLAGLGQKSSVRYPIWFDQWMGHHYRRHIGADQQLHVFLSGADCYALRCSLLHHGETDIRTQRARQALDNFHFVAPQPGIYIHCNQSNNTLQLQVDVFAVQMADAVDAWAASVKDDKTIQERMKGLLTIHEIGNRFSF